MTPRRQILSPSLSRSPLSCPLPVFGHHRHSVSAHLTRFCDGPDEAIAKLPKKLLDVLLPFQVDGLRFGLQRGGRCLIADEMGLGKTLQVTILQNVLSSNS
ncbi:DNA annealing helicase and endonuclease ZRANB3, partial [Linum perenne]